MALLDTCERQPVRVAVVDLFAGGITNFGAIRHLKQRLPRLTLIAYVDFTPDRAHDLFDAGRQGMDALVIADQDDAPRAATRHDRTGRVAKPRRPRADGPRWRRSHDA